MQPDNPAKVAEFFENFFKDNQELRHLFHVVVDDGNYQAEWAVAGYTSAVDGYNITNTHNPTTPKKPQVPNNPTTPKRPQVPNNPTTPKEPQVPNNGNKVTPKAYTQGKTYEKTGKLPQTGNESSMGMMLIGLVTLLLSLGLVVISRFTI